MLSRVYGESEGESEGDSGGRRIKTWKVKMCVHKKSTFVLKLQTDAGLFVVQERLETIHSNKTNHQNLKIFRVQENQWQ